MSRGAQKKVKSVCRDRHGPEDSCAVHGDDACLSVANWELLHNNSAAFPLYEFTCQLATLAPPPPEMQQLLGALKGNQKQTNRFFGLFAQTVSVAEFFSPENMQEIFGQDRGVGT
jgi:hypothetical protein